MPRIGNPFANVARHVVQAKSIGWIAAHGGPSTRPDLVAVLIIEIVRICRRERQTTRKRTLASCGARIFPLCFRRQAIGVTRHEREPFAVGARIVPAHSRHRQQGFVLKKRLTGEGCVFRDRDRIPRERDRARDFYAMFRPLEIAREFVIRMLAHCEKSERQIDHRRAQVTVAPGATGSQERAKFSGVGGHQQMGVRKGCGRRRAVTIGRTTYAMRLARERHASA